MPDLLSPFQKCFEVSVYTSVLYIPYGNILYNCLKREL